MTVGVGDCHIQRSDDVGLLVIRFFYSFNQRDYWDAPDFGNLSNTILAVKVFDLGVNVGPQRAIRLLQMAANRLGASLFVDGIIGPKTIGCVNSYQHKSALMAAFTFKIVAGNYYIGLNRQRYIAGWLSRLDS